MFYAVIESLIMDRGKSAQGRCLLSGGGGKNYSTTTVAIAPVVDYLVRQFYADNYGLQHSGPNTVTPVP